MIKFLEPYLDIGVLSGRPCAPVNAGLSEKRQNLVNDTFPLFGTVSMAKNDEGGRCCSIAPHPFYKPELRLRRFFHLHGTNLKFRDF
jgi:hypothetical protein